MLLKSPTIENSQTLLEQSPKRQDSEMNNNQSRAQSKESGKKKSIFVLNSFLNSKSHRLQLLSTMWDNVLK